MPVIHRCEDMFRAHAIRSRLAAAGIDAIVTGADAGTALSMGGAPTNSLVRIEVAAKDKDRASKILAEDAARMQDATAWVCGRCDEINEPAFELCWSCNKSRDASDLPPTIEPTDPFRVPNQEPGVSANVAIEFVENGNPYQPSASNSSAHASRSTGSDKEDQDQAVKRLLYGSIAGLVLAFPVISIYVLVQCIQFYRGGRSGNRIRSRLLFAIIINVVAILFWTAFWLL